MYNDIKRCDNHIDYFTTLGQLNEIFKGVLYGYYYEYQQSDLTKPTIKFTLYFVTPFDNIYVKKYGDYNRSYQKEMDGFKNTTLNIKSESTKNMQIVPLQYDDYYAGDERGLIDKTRPSFNEAITTNIYKDDRGFFERLIHKKSPYQIKEILDHDMFYKVTFNVPFDVIADYVTVDKILVNGDIEKTKNLYSPPDINYVDGLSKRLRRTRSLLDEMEVLIQKIRSDPIKFKKDNKDSDWSEECRTKGGLNIDNAAFLFKKTKADFEKMQDVLFNAMAFDIHKEPKELVETKCSHDLCIRDRIEGSKFCGKCIQLSTVECNYCQLKAKAKL